MILHSLFENNFFSSFRLNWQFSRQYFSFVCVALRFVYEQFFMLSSVVSDPEPFCHTNFSLWKSNETAVKSVRSVTSLNRLVSKFITSSALRNLHHYEVDSYNSFSCGNKRIVVKRKKSIFYESIVLV